MKHPKGNHGLTLDCVWDLLVVLVATQLVVVVCVVSSFALQSITQLAFSFLPVIFAGPYSLYWWRHYREAVGWAREKGVELLTVSPRILPCRKGRFEFPQLAVIRLTAWDKTGSGVVRGGWLVAYIPWGPKLISPWNDIKVHWDDEE